MKVLIHFYSQASSWSPPEKINTITFPAHIKGDGVQPHSCAPMESRDVRNNAHAARRDNVTGTEREESRRSR